ncbi:MAG: polymer-forming cytoskeletal protein [Rickettsiales bacterium]
MFFRERKKAATPKIAGPERRHPHIPSVLSAEMTVHGDFVSKGGLEIEGKVEGNIACETVAVRRNAEVKGNITANHVQLDGMANGMIKAKTILVSPGAVVSGVIYYETLTVKDGASLNAQCKSLSELIAVEGKAPGDHLHNADSGLFEEMTIPDGAKSGSEEEDDDARQAVLATLHKDFEDETDATPAKSQDAPIALRTDEADKTERMAVCA